MQFRVRKNFFGRSSLFLISSFDHILIQISFRGGRRLRIREEQLVIVVQDVVIDLLLHSLDRVLNDAASFLIDRFSCLFFLRIHIRRLLHNVLLSAEKTSLERHSRVEVDALDHLNLLVLKHLSTSVSD